MRLSCALPWENDEVARQSRDRVAVALKVLQDRRGIDGQAGEAIRRHQHLALEAPGPLTNSGREMVRFAIEREHEHLRHFKLEQVDSERGQGLVPRLRKLPLARALAVMIDDERSL